MGVYAMEMAAKLKRDGKALGREGMSLRVIAAVKEFEATGGTYKGAIYLAGRLKAIAAMTAADSYWREKMADGFQREARTLADAPSNPHPTGDKEGRSFAPSAEGGE